MSVYMYTTANNVQMTETAETVQIQQGLYKVANLISDILTKQNQYNL